MIKHIKTYLKAILVTALLYLIYICFFVIYGTITDYNPKYSKNIYTTNRSSFKTINKDTLSLTSWNIGYAGLNKNSDFFYDSKNIISAKGKMVRPYYKEQVEKNLFEIKATLTNHPSDFYLLQEIDIKSKRSYHINQKKSFESSFPNYSSAFAFNYKVNYIPIPILEFWHALGKVQSGLLSLSQFQPQSSIRYPIIANYSWPNNIFHLDRCLLIQKFAIASSNSYLTIVNIHHSAFDSGKLKKEQMISLNNIISTEYQKGNYVIVGGDWNQTPPDFDLNRSIRTPIKKNVSSIESNYTDNNWTWAFDSLKTTNRSVKKSYQKGITPETIIDFFLLSPNIQLLKIKVIDEQFKYSDHQPIYIKIKLLNLIKPAITTSLVNNSSSK